MKFQQILCLLAFLTTAADAFAPLPISRTTATATAPQSSIRNRQQHQQLWASSSSSSSKNKNTNDDDIAEGEYQELAAVFGEMNRSNILSTTLEPALRVQIEDYVRKVASKRPTAIPLKDIGKVLPGTQWKLIFSTAATAGARAMEGLPKDAQVRIEFAAETADTGNTGNTDTATSSNTAVGGQLDYILEFSQTTFGLKRLVAKSSYTVDDTNINPGLVTFVYDDIVTDVFGLTNLGVGFFGMLKGRANYVETVFMDQRFWMERGYAQPDGTEFVNVYLRQGLVEEAPTTSQSAAAATRSIITSS
eukprot:CAMPEP_0119024208 /NCGR_PEP_ID=MMETSP1176-20130426/31454_1 /TAXON_ID=265551 /ORGANISM="Synedropsis recta cf, Strain CCMP1620" /LENGTH=304 /DNA_ID=CAMNT_0006979443 /DNA_START=165 /DNA_END=1076 /DNA_ORIENTATION=+